MAKIDISSINGMHESATSIREKCEAFKTTAEQLKAATDTLVQDAEGWQAEASEIFAANITDAKRWLDEIAQVVVEFSTAIDDTAVKYVQTDTEAAKGFK